jgi:ketopantoate reductase
MSPTICHSRRAREVDDWNTKAVEWVEQPVVGPRTLILPLLNGMRRLDRLDERFGADRVLGGRCLISTTLDPDGQIFEVDLGKVASVGRRRRVHCHSPSLPCLLSRGAAS